MKVVAILLHALVGWVLCAAVMGVGTSLTSMENTLIVHAVGVPIIFGLVSFVCFKHFDHTSPLQTALIVLGVVVILDVLVVALVMAGSFEMFTSLLGTWTPFFLIFTFTYGVGAYLRWNSSMGPRARN